MKKKLIPLNDNDQIPENLNIAQTAEFWDSHVITKEFLEKNIVDQSEIPIKQSISKSVTLRVDSDTLERIKTLAKIKNKKYQTMMKQFIIERLYEEESKLT